MRRLLVAVFASALALAPVGLVSGSAHADDGYTPTVPTSCNIDAPSVRVGQRVVLDIEVSSNGNVPEVGTVKLAISTAGAQRAAQRAAKGVVWTKTVRYEGSPITVRGPKLPRGLYRVTMAFTPDDGQFLPCRNSVGFRVGAGGDVDEEEEGGGGLPNTGGPHLSLLLAGLALLVGGGGLVAESRRRIAPRTV